MVANFTKTNLSLLFSLCSDKIIAFCFSFVNRFIKVHVDYQGRSQTFRPCPVFILTQLSPGWCGGVLTGIW